MRVPATVLIPVEALSMCALAVTFGASLSYVLSISMFFTNRLNAAGSVDLTMFAMVIPLSKSYIITAVAGWLLVLTSLIIGIADAYSQARAKARCSFRPSVSSLGMGSEREAIVPMEVRSRVPTMYLPNKTQHVAQEGMVEGMYDEEKGFAKEAEKMPRSDSALSERSGASREMKRQMTGPQDPRKPEETLRVRPSKPWTEPRSPKRRDDVIHAM